MKIILLENVYKHGVAGEVVEVTNGFARNYLIPKGLATKATPGAMKRHAKIRDASEGLRQEYEDMLNTLGRKIDGTQLTFFRRAANSGKLFGSVTTQEITEALDKATNVDINRRRLSQQGLRDVGLHEVPVRLGADVSPMLFVRVIREDQEVAYNRQLEAMADGLLDEVRFDEDGSLIDVDLNQIRSRQEREEAEAEAAAEIDEIREEAEVEAPSDFNIDYDDVPPAGEVDDEDEA